MRQTRVMRTNSSIIRIMSIAHICKIHRQETHQDDRHKDINQSIYQSISQSISQYSSIAVLHLSYSAYKIISYLGKLNAR